MYEESGGDEIRISPDGLIILLEVQYGVRISIHEGPREEFIARAVSTRENPRSFEEQACGADFEDALDRLEEALESFSGRDSSLFGQ